MTADRYVKKKIELAHEISGILIDNASEHTRDPQVMVAAFMIATTSAVASMIAILGSEKGARYKEDFISDFLSLLDGAIAIGKENVAINDQGRDTT